MGLSNLTDFEYIFLAFIFPLHLSVINFRKSSIGFPEIKEELWTYGYFVSTACQHGEGTLKDYVKNQGKGLKYEEVYRGQLELF